MSWTCGVTTSRTTGLGGGENLRITCRGFVEPLAIMRPEPVEGRGDVNKLSPQSRCTSRLRPA